jgi:hypothetical protein
VLGSRNMGVGALNDAAPAVIADGRRLTPHHVAPDTLAYVLSAGARALGLASRSFIPCEIDAACRWTNGKARLMLPGERDRSGLKCG